MSPRVRHIETLARVLARRAAGQPTPGYELLDDRRLALMLSHEAAQLALETQQAAMGPDWIDG